MAGSCIIVIGGDAPYAAVRARLPDAELVIAADSGLDHAEALGLRVDRVLGDLDSVSKGALDRARRAGIPIDEHPTAKDQTDLELALDAALDEGADRILVVSGGGGRLDHLVAGLLALAEPAARGAHVEAFVGSAHVVAIHGPGTAEVTGRPSELVTLLPIGGPARGVRTEGLRFPLHAETLPAATSRGVSNELLSTRGRVFVEAGDLLVIQPEALEVAP